MPVLCVTSPVTACFAFGKKGVQLTCNYTQPNTRDPKSRPHICTFMFTDALALLWIKNPIRFLWNELPLESAAREFLWK